MGDHDVAARLSRQRAEQTVARWLDGDLVLADNAQNFEAPGGPAGPA
jgi:hypothetical protein